MNDNITLPREVVQKALEALGEETAWFGPTPKGAAAITALRTALAAEQPKPSDSLKAMKEAFRILTKPESGDLRWQVSDACDILRTAIRTAPPDAEALRRDAERYRWLRERAWFQFEFDGRYGDSGETVQELDAAIDAAMGDKT